MFRNVLLSAVLLSSASAFAVDTYIIDASHTAVVFKVNHLGFSDVYGQIPKVSGEFKVDEKKVEKSSLNVEMDMSSIITHDAKRDDHLKNADFFNVKEFPKMTFKSTGIKKSGSAYEITGQLTMHGVTKPLTFTFNRARTGKDPWGKTRTGGSAQFVVKRSEFGMNYMQGENQVGDDVTVMLAVEGVKK